MFLMDYGHPAFRNLLYYFFYKNKNFTMKNIKKKNLKKIEQQIIISP